MAFSTIVVFILWPALRIIINFERDQQCRTLINKVILVVFFENQYLCRNDRGMYGTYTLLIIKTSILYEGCGSNPTVDKSQRGKLMLIKQ